MGSNFKTAVLEEHIVKLIKQWHVEAKQKKKKQDTSQSGRGYSSTNKGLDYSNTTNNSHGFSSHHRATTSHEIISPCEIVELQPEIIPQLELDHSIISSPTNMVDTEIQKVGQNPGQT